MTTMEAINTAIQVFDDVLVDPQAYRAEALALSYGDVPAGGQVFHGIATFPGQNDVVQRVIERYLPGARVTLSFFRQSPEGQEEPNFLHSDRDMGDWTAILYLNPDPPAGDGTSFWRHRVTGAVSGDFDPAEAEDLTLWERWQHVDAKFGRLLIFQADYFHSRGIEENYGTGEDARLTQVVFGRRPATAGETVIRAAMPFDVSQIVDMGLRFLRTTEYRGRITENADQMASVAAFLMSSPERALFVAERDGRLVGMIGLVLFNQPLSGELTAGEWFWWVDEAYRGRLGIKLLRHAERWAEAAGAVVIQMIAPNAAIEQVYELRGYDRIEVAYQKRIGRA